MTENKPVKVFRTKNVKVSIWKKSLKSEKTGDEFDSYSTVLVRSYKDKEDKWQDEKINAFDINELTKIKTVVGEAIKYLVNLSEE